MSPAGFASGYAYVWVVNTTGNIGSDYFHYTYRLRAVLILTADTQISSGDGTKENPFTIG
jgi:hypothetical protein